MGYSKVFLVYCNFIRSFWKFLLEPVSPPNIRPWTIGKRSSWKHRCDVQRGSTRVYDGRGSLCQTIVEHRKPMGSSVNIGWHLIGFLGGQHSSSSLASAFLTRISLVKVPMRCSTRLNEAYDGQGALFQNIVQPNSSRVKKISFRNSLVTRNFEDPRKPSHRNPRSPIVQGLPDISLTSRTRRDW